MSDKTPPPKLKIAKTFEELHVFQRSYKISLEIHKMTLKLPREEQFGGMGDQMRRCSKSICANIAEGFAKNSYQKDFKRFVLIAVGSSEEMRVWLRYAFDLGYIDSSTWQIWRDEYTEISRMLWALTKTPLKAAA